ncbi:MAG: PD-(D/E)XK nuclease-like domain-containing protein [Synechococcaceae cyanobacterium]|nr:PD-(D/E)XK nuclease-like domain-containing protein [Synechococcaceae cyanobacterium]
MPALNLADYHRHPAWSPTALKAAITGTMRAWWHRFGPEARPFVPTPDMVKGDLVDALLTPPFSIEERFQTFATVARNTRAGAANCAEAEAAGLTPISTDMLDQARRIRDALHADPVIGAVLAAMDVEHSQQPHFWSDAAGRPCRCLPDVVTTDGRLFDIKKTRSAIPRRFYWQARDLAYDLQMAHLELGHLDRHGREPAECGVIAFEWPGDPEAPIDCSLLIFDEQDLQGGRARREEAFARIAACQASGLWPSHGRAAFRPVPTNFSLRESAGIDPETIALF